MTGPEILVIARYSAVTVPLFLILIAAMAACCIWGGLDSGYAILVWAGVLFGITIPPFVLLLIFRRGRAIEIKDGKLLYSVSFFPRGIGIRDVEDVRVEVQELTGPIPLTLTMIVLKGRGRWWHSFPAFLLSEDAEVVVARLREALGLPKTA